MLKITISKEESGAMAGRRIDHAMRPRPWKGVPLALVIGLLGFGLAVVAALIFDGSRIMRGVTERRSPVVAAADLLVEMASSTNRHRDAARAFSIALPPGWTVLRGVAAEPFNLRMAGPNLMGIAVQVTPASYSNIDTLVGLLEGIERDNGVHTHIERVEFKGYPAVRRQSRLVRVQLVMLDVLAEGREYHLQFNLPAEMDEAYRPVAMEMLNSFEPIQAVPGDEATL